MIHWSLTTRTLRQKHIINREEVEIQTTNSHRSREPQRVDTISRKRNDDVFLSLSLLKLYDKTNLSLKHNTEDLVFGY